LPRLDDAVASRIPLIVIVPARAQWPNINTLYTAARELLLFMRGDMRAANVTEGSRSAASQTVAVIDDDFLESLHDLLDATGLGVRLFASAGGFLRTSAVYEVDCMISDAATPAIDALALRRLIREARPTLSVILVSGPHEFATTSETDRGGRILLEKPFDRESLLAATDSELRVSAGGR
jgi:response regulator RpfG family c-di-GMP phosphodiesterase